MHYTGTEIVLYKAGPKSSYKKDKIPICNYYLKQPNC